MLLNKIKKYNVYLASKSPRRQELLKNMGIKFMITANLDIDEKYPNNLYKEKIPVFLSNKKADAYFHILKPNDILITADTIVWADEQVLEKPQNKLDATNMLKKLSGKKHQVITGLTLTNIHKKHSFFCTTDVWFKKITTPEIEYYLENYKPYDKAGAYGIQEWIGFIAVEKITGSYFNVVGLPVQKLYTELEKFISTPLLN